MNKAGSKLVLPIPTGICLLTEICLRELMFLTGFLLVKPEISVTQ